MKTKEDYMQSKSSKYIKIMAKKDYEKKTNDVSSKKRLSEKTITCSTPSPPTGSFDRPLH